jgi:hypothetical protein
MALELVVMEEVRDGRPKCERVHLAPLMDNVQDLRRTGGVHPVDNALVNLVPVGIAVDDRSQSRDMHVEAELVEGGVKEHAPVGEVRIVELQHDWNMGMDVDRLDGVDGGARHWT